MTQDEIIEMADKCGLMGYFELDGDSVGQLGIEAFAKLIADKERAECICTVSIAFLDAEKELADRVLNALFARGEA